MVAEQVSDLGHAIQTEMSTQKQWNKSFGPVRKHVHALMVNCPIRVVSEEGLHGVQAIMKPLIPLLLWLAAESRFCAVSVMALTITWLLLLVMFKEKGI